MIGRITAQQLTFAALLAAGLIFAGCTAEPAKEPTTTATPAVAPAAIGTEAITFRIDPNPPVGGKDSTVHVSVHDSAGKPVEDAKVQMTLTMPAMPEMKMAEMKNSADLKWTGSDYSGPVQIMMKGGWDVVVEAKRGEQVVATYKTHLDAH